MLLSLFADTWSRLEHLHWEKQKQLDVCSFTHLYCVQFVRSVRTATWRIWWTEVLHCIYQNMALLILDLYLGEQKCNPVSWGHFQYRLWNNGKEVKQTSVTIFVTQTLPEVGYHVRKADWMRMHSSGKKLPRSWADSSSSPKKAIFCKQAFTLQL